MSDRRGALTGATALVTGGGQGIGAEIVRILVQEGASVAINHPDVASQPRDTGDLPTHCFTVCADVSDRQQVAAMFLEMSRRFGRLDILVNNAGIFPRSPVMDIDEEMWDAVLDTNLKGTFFCAQEAARIMSVQGYGRIVNIVSSAAFTGSPLGAHYSASKAGVVGLTKSLARSLAQYGITVNAVAPGMVETSQPGLDARGFVEEGRRIPLGRVGRPRDVADLVLFLVSDACSFVTGQTINVNGGALMLP